MCVFFLKIHFHPMGFIHSSGLTKVHTWLTHMESTFDFMASSQLSYSTIQGFIVSSRLIDLYEQYVPLVTNEKSIFLWNNTYPPCARMCLYFRRIACYFINLNNGLILSELTYICLRTLNFTKFIVAPIVFS